jgi:flagellar motility protein MotE (MotC chaperone)
MLPRPRLLPVLIVSLALLFGAKLADLWLAIGIDPLAAARAQTEKPEAKKEEHAAAAPTANPAPDSHGAAPAAGEKPATGAPKPTDAGRFSAQEIQLLQTLAQRRDELARRAGEIEQREALLQAAEQRINDKIAKLEQMQKTIDQSFKKQDQLDDSKLQSLVKIYETMKPQEAARIFEQLDPNLLLDVVERMKEKKTASILAAMDPTKAKAVTLALAERHPSPELKAQ